MTLRPIKRLGQHFLVDPNTIRKIVDQLEAPPDAVVVEIGPGPGALTEYLVEAYEHLVAIEVDGRAVEVLRERFGNLDVREMDVLDVEYGDLLQDRSRQEPLYVIGNLPYNITSQILFGLLDAGCIKRAVLTMQKEVAERLVARPRTKAYGILSVVTQLQTRPRNSIQSFSKRIQTEAGGVELDRSSRLAACPSAAGRCRPRLAQDCRADCVQPAAKDTPQ